MSLDIHFIVNLVFSALKINIINININMWRKIEPKCTKMTNIMSVTRVTSVKSMLTMTQGVSDQHHF